MKKQFLFIAFILLSTLSISAQYKSPFWTVLPIKDSAIIYTEVVKVDSTLTSDALYSNAKIWLAETFYSSKDVIQSEDVSNKTIVGKGLYKANMGGGTANADINFTIKIECKNGRYKYSFYDLKYFAKDLLLWGGSDTEREKTFNMLNSFALDIDNSFKTTILSLKKNMINKTESW